MELFKMLPSILLIVLLNFCSQSAVKGELFTALVDLTRALHAEEALSDSLMHYVSVEQTRLQRVYQLARDLADHTKVAQRQGLETYVANPVNAFLLVKRFNVDWKEEVQNLVERRQAVEELLQKLKEVENDMPSRDDLKGSTEALLRLQDTYKLPTSVIADGVIHPLSRSSPLTAEECFYLGRYAYQKDDFAHAQQWLSESLRRLDSTDGIDPNGQLNRSLVLDYLAYALYKVGDYSRAKAITQDLLEIEPDNERAQTNLKHFEVLLKRQEETPQQPPPQEDQPQDEDDYYKERRRYESLCRGEHVMDIADADRLHCRYHVPHPFFLIGPIKEEVLHLTPRLVMWYDIIHDQEIEIIKESATPRLNRATVQNAITGKLEYAPYRISKSAWLPYELNEVTARLNNRIMAMTGLSIDTAEDLQVVNYGIGGQYEPHFDFARKREKSAFEKRVGNRIATLIYYLSDVVMGGKTVFTEIGATVTPVKGAAAFWWNLFPNGEGDLSTRHAACPVLIGSKWVMNKWFHERGQEFHRPCQLQENATE